MKRADLKGKIMTVLGLIEPECLGKTMTHEHLIIDITTWVRRTYGEPLDDEEWSMLIKPVTPDIYWWLRYHPFRNIDDCQLLDEQTAIDEVMMFKAAGGHSIVDVTVKGLARNPVALARISRLTGINIIMGTGHYVEPAYPITANISGRSEQDIAEEFIKDIFDGVGYTGVHAGAVDELGCTCPITENEKKVLRAGAIAQQKTGAILGVHPGREEECYLEVLRILDKAGADLSRTIICHIDRSVRNPKTRIQIAKAGCYLEYDLFGREGYYPPKFQVTDLPNDHQRINELMDLADKGYADHIILSQDCCNKTSLCKYGGWGYGHILRDVVPVMRQKGMSEKLINTFLIDNPKRAFTFI